MRLIIISPPEDIPDEPEVICRVPQQSSATVYFRKPGQTDRQIADCLKQVPVPTKHTVIALGGLDAQRTVKAASLGFKGIAMLGAVWQTFPPEKVAGQLSAVCAESDWVRSTIDRRPLNPE